MESEKIINWLKEYVSGVGAKGIVFGLSGGIDSAVVAGLAVKAFGDNALGIIMPCESIDEDEKDARLIAKSIGLNVEKVDLTSTYKSLIDSSFYSDNKMAMSNIKPRLRMTTLYYYAQDRNLLVASGSNASEFFIGYFTKHGDSGADIYPIIEYLKDEVVDLAHELNIPKRIIDKAPSAGLWQGQSDEKEMGFSYEDLGNYMRGGKIEENTSKKIERMHKKSEHKRHFPPGYNRK